MAAMRLIGGTGAALVPVCLVLALLALAWLVLGAGCSEDGALAGDTGSATPGRTGDLVFTRRSVDLGRVDEGTEPVARFAFENRGGTPVLLRDAIASCTCSGVALRLGGREIRIVGSGPVETSIPASASGHLAVRLATLGQEGPKHGAITCYTDDGTVELSWSFEVLPLCEVEPREIVLGSVRADQPRTFSARVLAQPGTTWRVVGVLDHGLPPGYEAHLAELADIQQRGWLVEGRVDPRAEGFHPSAVIRLSTDHARVREITIPVVVQLDEVIRVEPGTLLSVRSADLRRGTELLVRISTRDGSELAVDSVRLLDGNRPEDMLTWSHPDPAAHAASVELRAQVAPCRFQGVVRMRYAVRLDHPAGREVSLTVLGFAR